MVLSDWQFAAVNFFYTVLKSYVSRLSPPLYVAVMLPIRYHPLPGDPRVQQLAPDILAAHVDPHFRSSYRLEEERVAPTLVLEVVSRESRQRDTVDKRRAYEAMGVQEYAVFDPVGGLPTPRLQGYRREGERLARWEQDSEGKLWSEVLGAWLAVVGEELRLERRDGTLEPSPAEEALARERAEEEVRLLGEELARLRASLQDRDAG